MGNERATSPGRGLMVGAFFGALVAGGAVFGLMQALKTQAPPPVLATVGPWTLESHAGKPFGSADLEGRVWVANFIFTRCLMSCPKITQAQKEVSEKVTALDGGKRVRFVSFSVDPTFDRPPVLSAYAQKHKLDVDRWTMVTGPSDSVFALLRDKMFAHIGEQKIHGDPAEGLIDIAHLERLAVFDQQGRLRATAPVTAEGQAALLLDIEALLAQPAGG